VREATKRYRDIDSDSARWEGFPFREGDVVISAPLKRGTTWMQMICPELVFHTPHFDRPLAEISPWFDMLTTDRNRLVDALEAQFHRRMIKAHAARRAPTRRSSHLHLHRSRSSRCQLFLHHMTNVNIDAAWPPDRGVGALEMSTN
jgi:hypothetical protein